jgi:GT2 family glycosyltransferase
MLNQISIGIKTLLRDEKLFRALDGISNTMPEAHVIVADDGRTSAVKEGYYASMESSGHTIIRLPFDSGFGAKANAIANALARPYLLVASDDFDFSTPNVRVGVEKMLEVLEGNPELSVASGSVDSRAYECMLLDEGHTVTELRPFPFITQYYAGWYPVDLTMNYSLIRREVFEKVRWDDDVKIGGGEHGAFFVDLKRAGFKVGFVPEANINAQPGRDSDEYRKFRWRALRPERECFDRRGIKKYVMANGQIDYERKN